MATAKAKAKRAPAASEVKTQWTLQLTMDDVHKLLEAHIQAKYGAKLTVEKVNMLKGKTGLLIVGAPK